MPGSSQGLAVILPVCPLDLFRETCLPNLFNQETFPLLP